METLRHTAVSFRCGKLDLDGVISSPVEDGCLLPGLAPHSHPGMVCALDQLTKISDADTYNVLYRRRDGAYGLIEPDPL